MVAVCAEYDALPDIGHACGHNIIAASAVGAGLALSAVADQIGVQVRVRGTPAEEGGGGKIFMLDRGAFEGVHAAMMMPPWPTDRLTGACLAVSHFDVHFAGREAHASAAPWEGVNALDAMTISQVALGLLRQQLPPGDQFHGVITQGGQAANVIPAAVTGRFMVRSRTIDGLNALFEPRVKACFEAGALAHRGRPSPTRTSPRCTRTWRLTTGCLPSTGTTPKHWVGTSRPTTPARRCPPSPPTWPMCHWPVPTIHPLVGIETGGAVNHQHAFAAACVTESADAAVRDGALALAWTAIDAATDPGVRRRLLGIPA